MPGHSLNTVAAQRHFAPDALLLGPVSGLQDQAHERDAQLTERTSVRSRSARSLQTRRIVVGHRRRLLLHRRRVDVYAAVWSALNAIRCGPGASPARATESASPGCGRAKVPCPPSRPNFRRPKRCSSAAASPGLACSTLAAKRWSVDGGCLGTTGTLESEALLADAYRWFGGKLVRLAAKCALPAEGLRRVVAGNAGGSEGKGRMGLSTTRSW